MSDRELCELAHVWIGILRQSVSDPQKRLDEDTKEFERLIDSEDHCCGLVIGFARGYRLCEEMTSKPTLQPGSN
jgi:hypothetical protein